MTFHSKLVSVTSILSFAVAPSWVGAFKANPACGDYCASTGCDWTDKWSCPWAKSPGSSGRAKDDGSVGYNCCCVQRTSQEDQLCGGEKTMYNETHARMFATLSSLSYCDDMTHVHDWSCKGCTDRNTPQLIPGKIRIIDAGVQNATRILIGRLRDQAGCLMVFRGTDNDFNWKRNAEYAQVVPEGYEDCQGCRVHTGFYTIWKNVRDDAMQALRDVGCGPTDSNNPNNLMYVTGHSLGAALSQLAMFTMQNQGFRVAKTYVFEAPRVGNKAFADAFASNFQRNIDVFRITHAQDPVVHLPPNFLGYEHVQTEVFYDRDGNHRVCPDREDSSCSDQYWDIPGMLYNNMGDHCMMPKTLSPFQNLCNPQFYGLCGRSQESQVVMV